MHAVNMCGVNENSNVLITGGGAIGLFAAAAAKAKGAKYVALTEANPGRIKIAEEADFVDEDFDAADSEIGEKVMGHLKEIDEVAYVRFASVHKRFSDINSFMEALKALLEDK
jgi:threonine dehydrogenase-like Zn-dependent dehydrogenase